MSDELRGVSYYMRKAYDAEIELTATRAERDEQKRRADYLSKDFDRDIKMYQAEVAELRTNLAAANARIEDALRNKDIITDWWTQAKRRAEAAEARAEKAEEFKAEFEAKKATPENQFELMLYDTITERNQCRIDLRNMTQRAEAAEARERALREALRYAKRFLKPDVCDVVFIHGALNKGETNGQG